MKKNDVYALIFKSAKDVIEDLDVTTLTPQDKLPVIGAGEVEQALILDSVLDELALAVPIDDFGYSSSIGGLAENVISRAEEAGLF